MERVTKQYEGFVVTAASRGYVQRLNTAVRACKILPIVGESGCGKTRFLDWWLQVASSDAQFAGTQPIQPEEILLIEAAPALRSIVPMACVIFTKLLAALEGLEAGLLAQRRPQQGGRIRSWFTDRQLLSLVYEHVHPLFDQLQPQAVVVTNAHLLDDHALQLLLELRRSVRRGMARVPRCALILCGQSESSANTDSRLSKLMHAQSETRAAWPNHIHYQLMNTGEFGRAMLDIVQQNLQAAFAPDVDVRATLQLFGTWTHANWWLIDELTQTLDTALGPGREGTPRLLTNAVIANVQHAWLARNTST